MEKDFFETNLGRAAIPCIWLGSVLFCWIAEMLWDVWTTDVDGVSWFGKLAFSLLWLSPIVGMFFLPWIAAAALGALDALQDKISKLIYRDWEDR